MSDMVIESRQNPLVKQLIKLQESAKERKKQGVTVLEGIHLVSAALAAGQVLQRCVLAQSAQNNKEVMQILLSLSCPVTWVSDAVFKHMSELKTPTGILAIWSIPCVNPVLQEVRTPLLLEDIQDPGNIGSILRSAAATGVDAVYCSPACADVYAPRVLRAGMGAHFVLPIVPNAALINIAQAWHGHLFATSLQASYSLYEVNLRGASGFMLGNEGAGLSSALQACAHQSIIIPMLSRVESLNVAAAAAVCLFEQHRQRIVAAV